MLKKILIFGKRYTRSLLARASIASPRLSSDATPLPGETVDLERRIRDLEAERDALAAALMASRDPMPRLDAHQLEVHANATLEAARDNNQLAQQNLALAQRLTAVPRDDRSTANPSVHLKIYVIAAELARVQRLNAELQNELRTKTFFPSLSAQQGVLLSEPGDAHHKSNPAAASDEPQTPLRHVRFQSVAEHLSKVVRQ